MQLRYINGRIILIVDYKEYSETKATNHIFDRCLWDKNNKVWYAKNNADMIDYCKEHNINIIDIDNFYNQLILPEEKIPEYLFPFQKEAIKFLWQTKIKGLKGANLFFDVGTGKTITSLAFANLFKTKKLILCPSALKEQWKQEILKFNLATPEQVQIISGTKQKRLSAYSNLVLYNIIGYESFRVDSELLMADFIIICDEASKLKNQKTELYKRFNSFNKKSTFTIMLTATPMENNLGNIYNICRLHNKSFIDYNDFINNYCITDEVNGKTFIAAYIGVENFTELIKDFSLIKKKKDVAKELPPITIQNRMIENTPFQNKTAKLLIMDNLFTNFTKLRMLDNGLNTYNNEFNYTELSEKTKELRNILTEMGNKKIIIFADYLVSVQEIYYALSKDYNVIKITGEDKNKEQLIDSFKSLSQGILLCTDVLSYGASFSDVEYIINYNLHPNPAKMYQRVGRAARINNPYPITVINLIGSCIEKYILLILEEKQNNINLFETTLKEDDIVKNVFDRIKRIGL